MTPTTTAVSGAGQKLRTFEDFVHVHGILLAASGVPKSLHRLLYQKLTSETFHSGDYFQVEQVEDVRQRRLVSMKEYMGKDSNVFLVDHAWTFRLADAFNQLQEVPGLAERMAAMMCVDDDLIQDEEKSGEKESNGKIGAVEIVMSEISKSKEEGVGAVRWLELDEMDIDDSLLVSLDFPSKFPVNKLPDFRSYEQYGTSLVPYSLVKDVWPYTLVENLLALSLYGNKLEDVEGVIKEITQLKNLRALWLNDNPVVKNGDGHLADAILQGCPNLEIYNSKFTQNFGEWALGFCGGIFGEDTPGHPKLSDHSLQIITSLDLSNRDIHNLINKAFTPVELPSLSYLNLRGNPIDENSFDELVNLLKEFSSLESLEVDIPGPIGDSAVGILEALPRILVLNGMEASQILESEKVVVDSVLQPRFPEWVAGEPLSHRVIRAMWLYLMTYRLADEEKIDETSIWYVMDELGSALRHSDKPNFRVAPFLFMPDGTLESALSYSILWPIDNVQRGDECTRDYLYGIGEEKQRSARLTAWFHTPRNYFIREFEMYKQKLQSTKCHVPSVESPIVKGLHQSDGTPLRVYSDMPPVEEFLTRREFVLTSEPNDADIIWTGAQIDEEMKKAAGLTDEQYINQFPFEACLVMKHHLAGTIEKAFGFPEWIQPTYNLETHLTQLIGDYYIRKRDGRDNLWILKPWNMARTIDTTITSDISAIIRLMETGPKICQKYIEHPALFQGRKFDLRYIILVRSIKPLEIFLTDVFWVRLANNAYSLDEHSFFEYETHFTVMNYRGRLNHMNTPEFVREFEKEHQVEWMDIHMRVKRMIRSVFESAAAVHPEMHNPKSRAMYGVDVMLTNDYQPKLLEDMLVWQELLNEKRNDSFLFCMDKSDEPVYTNLMEVTYCPDCNRACKFDTEAVTSGDGEIIKGSDFYNDVFGCLFLNETTHVSPV